MTGLTPKKSCTSHVPAWSLLLCTYRIQLLPHQHFKVVLVVQQVEYIRHLVVPSNAGEETHLKGAWLCHWSSEADHRPQQLAVFNCPPLEGQGQDQAAMLAPSPMPKKGAPWPATGTPLATLSFLRATVKC